MYMIHKLKPKAHFNPSFIMYGGSCLCIFGGRFICPDMFYFVYFQVGL